MNQTNAVPAHVQHTASLAGMIIGGLIAGCVCGLLPWYVGKLRGHCRLGMTGFFACLISGGFFGLLLAMPVALLFTVIIFISGKPGSKLPVPPSAPADGGK